MSILKNIFLCMVLKWGNLIRIFIFQTSNTLSYPFYPPLKACCYQLFYRLAIAYCLYLFYQHAKAYCFLPVFQNQNQETFFQHVSTYFLPSFPEELRLTTAFQHASTYFLPSLVMADGHSVDRKSVAGCSHYMGICLQYQKTFFLPVSTYRLPFFQLEEALYFVQIFLLSKALSYVFLEVVGYVFLLLTTWFAPFLFLSLYRHQ